MISILDGIHSILHRVLTIFLWPFEQLAPIWGLVAISIVLGLLLVLAYGKLSRQESIRRVKSQIYRALLESVLFRHDFKLSIAAQGKMLLQATRYFGLAVPPLLILGVPCLLILVQLNLWYGSRPLTTGQPSIVRVELHEATKINSTTLNASDDMQLTPPVRITSSREIFWRLTPTTQAAESKLALKVGSAEFLLPLVSEQSQAAQYHGAPIQSASYSSFWNRLLVPSGPIDGGSSVIEAIEVQYPEQLYNVAGLQLSWIVVFFVVSLVSGLIGSKVFGISV